MAASDKQRLKLEKDFLNAKNKEAAVEKQINALLEKGKDLLDEDVMTLDEKLEKLKQITAVEREQLVNHNKLNNLQKQHAQALEESTDQTKEILSNEIQDSAIKKLKLNSGFEEKDVLQEILEQRNEMIGLSGEENMLAFDLEDQLKEIETLLGDTTDMSKNELEFLEEQLKYNQQIAESLGTQAKTTTQQHDLQEGILGALGTSKGAMKGLVTGAKQFLAAIIANPILGIAALIMLAVTAMIKLVQYAGELRDELGVSLKQAGGLMLRLGPASLALKAMGLDAKEVGGALLTSFGTLDTLTNQTLIQAGAINYQFGATHESVAGLAKILSDQVGGTLSQNLDMVSEFGSQFEAAGIAAGAAMDDLASNAEFLSDYLDGSAQSMVDATIGARKLGLELGTVAKIADALLEFETSIASTMQASLLIGRQLNFDRARGLALEGKTNEAVQDIVGQLGGVAEFQQLNVVQRRGLAEALGVGTDELAALVRGEPIELDQDSELVTSNKGLIEAINNNTISREGGEALVSATSARNKQITEQKKTNDLLYLVMKDGKKSADANYNLDNKTN